MKVTRKRGFTLIEICITIGIIAVVVGMATHAMIAK